MGMFYDKFVYGVAEDRKIKRLKFYLLQLTFRDKNFFEQRDEKFSVSMRATPRKVWEGVEMCCVSEMRVPVN